MSQTTATKVHNKRRSIADREARSSSGERALRPPAYGIEFLDQQGSSPLERPASATGGFAPTPEELPQLGGIGETLQDVGDIVSTGVGNIVGAGAAALTGIDINTTNTVAATRNPHGQFMWHVGFNTTGVNGWIVQKVQNTYSGEDSAGVALTNARTLTTPEYYEAWAVDAASNVTPANAAGTNDMWERMNLSHPPIADAGTKGRWSMRGSVHFTTTNPAATMAAGTVANAGILLSSIGPPADIGVARLHRYAHGTWDSTVAPPTHDGSER